MFLFIRDFIKFTRAYQWHPGKMPLILGFALIMLIIAPSQYHGFVWILTTYVLASLYLAIVYMINNIADSEQDRILNKKMGLEGWSRWKRTIPVIIFIALGLGIGVIIMPVYAVFAMLGCYFLAWSYSCPPFRFKENIILGPFVSAFGHVAAPALMMAVAWGALPLPALSYLVVAFFYCLRMLLVHHLLDYENDRISGTRTTVIAIGITAARRLLYLIFTLEVFCTIVFFILIVNAGLPKILLFSLVWPLFLVILRLIRREPIRLDSYSYIPLADIHESVVPLILAIGVAMCEGNIMYATIPFIIVLFFFKRHIERLVIPILGWKDNTNA